MIERAAAGRSPRSPWSSRRERARSWLPLGIMQFQGQFGTDWARVMAFVTLLIIPAVAFYIFTEKYIITGLTGGELKG